MQDQSRRVYLVEYKANGVRNVVRELGYGAATTYAELIHRLEGCRVWIRRPGGKRVLAVS